MTVILVTGSRTWTDAQKVWEELDKVISKRVKEGCIIIQGGANGADSLARAYAIQKQIPLDTFKPLFPSNKVYYLHRNAEMIGACNIVVAFWDGSSRGTEFTIRYARKRGKEVIVVK